MSNSKIFQLSYYFQVNNEVSKNTNPFVTNCKTLGLPESTPVSVGNSLISSDGFHLEANQLEKVTATELARRFSNIPARKLMKVCFKKQDGSERILTGFRINEDSTALGYSQVIDLEADSKNNFRQVDHRAILWFVESNIGQNVVKVELK